MRLGTSILVMLIGLTISSPPIDAQQGPRTSPSLLKQVQDALRQRDQAIENLTRRVAVLEEEVATLKAKGGSSGIPAPATDASRTDTAPPNRAATPVVTPASSEEYDREELQARAALDRTLISRGGLLLPPGTMELDNGIAYSNASYDQLYVNGFTVYPVLVVGDIVSERTQRDIVLASLTTRVGLPHDLQLDVRIPYGYQLERTVTANNKMSSQRFLGLGDIEVGLTKQLRRGRGLGPDLLAGFRWKSSTGPNPYELNSPQVALGTGFQSLQGSLTAVKPSDPLVYFGNFSYTANLSTTTQIQSTDPTSPISFTTGYVNPGDTIGFQVGAALSVNPEASLNFALDQRFTRSASLNGKTLPGTFLSEAVFQVGTTYVYAAGRTVDLDLGMGLSRGAPDFQLSVDFPMRFSLARYIKYIK